MFAAKNNGIAQGAFHEMLLNIPTTAHFLGGCHSWRTDGPVVVLAGVEDLVVVVENGVVLVTRRESTSSVKAAVDALKTAGRGELL